MRTCLRITSLVAGGCLSLGLAAEEPTTPRLSVEDAVELGLAANADIAVERLVRDGSRLAAKEAEGFYEPYLTGGYAHDSLEEPGAIQPTTDPASGSTGAARDRANRSTDSWGVGLARPIGTGGSLRLDFDSVSVDTTEPLAVLSPEHSTSFVISAVQPLLRGRAIDEPRRRIRVARKDQAISEAQFRATVLDVVAAVKLRYIDVTLAREYRDTQRRLLELVTKLQEDNRERVEAGVLRSFDLLLGDSEMAARQRDLTVAERELARTEDALRRVVYSPKDRDSWSRPMELDELPPLEPRELDETAVVERALANRSELRSAGLVVERAEVLRSFARDQTRPAIDLYGSYGGLGLAGTPLAPSDDSGVPAGPRSGYGDALGDALSWEYPTWKVGVELAYPLFRRQSRAAEARARVARAEAQARLEQLEQAVIAEARDVVRSVNYDFERARLARQSHELQKQRFESEMELFGAGRNSPFFVIQAQRDLALSEIAFLRGVADYHRSLVNLERVEESAVVPQEPAEPE